MGICFTGVKIMRLLILHKPQEVRMKGKLFSIFSIIVLLVLGINQWVLAQEHPAEHPTEHKPKHRPITKETLAEAIENYIANEAKKHDGYFVFKNEHEGGKELKLQLIKVHKDRLAKLEDGSFFACADLKTPDNQIYDLDFMMKGTHADDLTLTNIWVHKKNGKPYYTWYEEKGVWKRKMVTEEKK